MGIETFPAAQSTNSLKGVRVLFCPDTGPSAGLGHLRRCLALALSLEELGAHCSWFLVNEDPVARRLVASERSEVIHASKAKEGPRFEEILRLIDECTFSAAVVDSYLVTANDLARLREKGLIVVSIDDLCAYAFPCQLVVNHGLRAPELSYRSSSGDTRFLLGSKYALLGPEFRNPRERKIRDRVQEVVVSLGGSDIHNLMPKLIRTLDDLPLDFNLSCVVGPFSKNRPDVEAAVNNCHRKTRITGATDVMREIFLESDLAVSAGGQTLFELAAVGTATIAVQVADNQADNLRGFAEKGVVRYVGRFSDPDLMVAVNRAVSMLANDIQSRLRMSEEGRRLIDGMGAMRVAACIAEAIGGT